MASVSIPETMKSVQMKNIGGPEVLQYKTDLPVPIPLDGEILVKNDFIGINYVDVFVLLLHIPCLQTNKFPNVLYQILAHQNDGGRSRLIIGREAEGVVVATGPGSVNNLRVGDHMVWLAIGGYAEYTAVPSLIAYPVPSDIEPGIAAASLLQGLFTMSLIHQLVHAAAGGVWMMLCRILKDLGAKTIGTTITAEKMKLAMGNVADYMIKYKEEQYLVKRIEEITGGQGEIIVYDGIGKDQAENNVNVVARHGTIVTYEAVSGIPAPLSPAKWAAKNVRFVGPAESALRRNFGTPEEFQKWCSKLLDTIGKDKVSVRVHKIRPLSQVVIVHQDLKARRTAGKVLMKP